MLDTQMIHRDSYTPKKTRWMRRLLTIALLVTICSASVSYIPFDLYTHGNIDWAISLISNLYLQGNIGVSTFIWYGVMLLLLWLAWTKSEKMQDSFDRAVWRVSCIVLFLSPSVFISPPPSFGAAFTDPSKWGTESEIFFLPAIICVVQYTLYLFFHFEDTYPIAATITLSVLPITAAWLVGLVTIVICKRREFLKS